MEDFKVIVRATSIKITPGKEAFGRLTPLVKLHTYTDDITGDDRAMGFIYDEPHDTLYFHKGVDISYVRRLLGSCKVIQQPFDEYKDMKYQFEEVTAPRDEDQRDVINFISGNPPYGSNIKNSQIFLVKKPGFGKSYCTGYGVGVLGMKTLIIIHRDNLRTQWYGSLVNMNGYPEQRVFVIDSVNDAVAIANGEYRPDADIYLVTHMTIHAALQRLGDMEAMSGLTRNLGIGMKVIDEAHLYFRSTLAIDCMFNVKRNLYLTATDGRSNKSEDAIFRQVFSNTEFYKRAIEMDEKHPSRWVDYITVFIDTHVKKGLYQYRVAPGGRMSPVTYGKFVIKHDKSQTHFKVCAEILRQIFEEDKDAKVLVFLPLIDLCMEGAYFFAQKLNYDDSFPMDLNIKTVHSRNSVEENELNKRADVIVTTVQSLGTGSDIKGVTSIINCTPLVSKINCEQILGRIRYINKPCHYYDIVDKSVQMDVFWWKSRSRTFGRLCTGTTQLSWTDEEG